jgi:hypothetical protein
MSEIREEFKREIAVAFQQTEAAAFEASRPEGYDDLETEEEERAAEGSPDSASDSDEA